MTDFGTDVSCLPDGLRTGRLVSGIRIVAESIARKLSTRPGTCPGAPTWGLYLPGMVGSSMTEAEIATLPGRIRSALVADERIASANVRVARADEGLDVLVHAETAFGPFDLVLAVSAVTVEILRLS